MALQRSAGNQAVGAILARFRSEEHGAKRQAGLTLDGLGPITLESVRPEGKGTRRFTLTLRGHSATAELNAAARNGRVFEQGTLVIGGLTFELKGVVISSLQISGDVLTLEIDAASASSKREANEDEKPQPTPRAELPPG
jgi:hypothetical protein